MLKTGGTGWLMRRAWCRLCSVTFGNREFYPKGDRIELGYNLWKAQAWGFLPVEASGRRKVSYKVTARGRSWYTSFLLSDVFLDLGLNPRSNFNILRSSEI